MVGGERLPEILLPCLADLADQFFIAARVAVVRVPRASVAVGGVDYGAVGGKVGVADAQVNDVRVFFQRCCVEGQPAGSVLKALCNVVFHQDSSLLRCGMTVAPLGMT